MNGVPPPKIPFHLATLSVARLAEKIIKRELLEKIDGKFEIGDGGSPLHFRFPTERLENDENPLTIAQCKGPFRQLSLK